MVCVTKQVKYCAAISDKVKQNKFMNVAFMNVKCKAILCQNSVVIVEIAL